MEDWKPDPTDPAVLFPFTPFGFGLLILFLALWGFLLSGCALRATAFKKEQDPGVETARILAGIIAAQQRPSPAPTPDSPLSGATECMICAATAPGAAYQCLPTACPKEVKK